MKHQFPECLICRTKAAMERIVKNLLVILGPDAERVDSASTLEQPQDEPEDERCG